MRVCLRRYSFKDLTHSRDTCILAHWCNTMRCIRICVRLRASSQNTQGVWQALCSTAGLIFEKKNGQRKTLLTCTNNDTAESPDLRH